MPVYAISTACTHVRRGVPLHLAAMNNPHHHPGLAAQAAIDGDPELAYWAVPWTLDQHQGDLSECRKMVAELFEAEKWLPLFEEKLKQVEDIRAGTRARPGARGSGPGHQQQVRQAGGVTDRVRGGRGIVPLF